MTNFSTIIRLPIIAALILWLFYQLIMLGMSAYYLDQSYKHGDEQLRQALVWDDSDSRALYLQARQQTTAHLQQAKDRLVQAIWHNPADTRALAAWSSLLAVSDVEIADKGILTASQLMPANKQVSLQAATYWLSRQNLSGALAAWGNALSIDPDLGQQLYPVFLKVSQHPEGRSMLHGFIRQPPRWWDDYLNFMLKHDSNVQNILELLGLHRQYQQPLSPATRKILVQQLISRQMWDKAYLIWAEALEKDQRQYLAGIFDGGFESGIDQAGFGWVIHRQKYIDASIQRVYGADDTHALEVSFLGKEMPFRHVYQYILLSPGDYQFHGKARTEILVGRGQLKWVVRCADNPSQLIGASQPILISQDWREYSFDFAVPDLPACRALVLRLETFGKHNFDHKLSGSAWFDSFRISQRHQLNTNK